MTEAPKDIRASQHWQTEARVNSLFSASAGAMTEPISCKLSRIKAENEEKLKMESRLLSRTGIVQRISMLQSYSSAEEVKCAAKREDLRLIGCEL